MVKKRFGKSRTSFATMVAVFLVEKRNKKDMLERFCFRHAIQIDKTW